ncbi:hypothetical protein [Guillardia theta]|uniref:Uncharacterized protein n=1 Tax=Guillardia theta TaxID=55529 RepID=Q9AVX6_GUITH|nr:hypothetical protein GTHECHR2181 [Guillardia theta]CAC27095.1 hypothetical protein [Guillardia theta]|mmetsp:Transcript_50741/g.158533  ORF Transcript_50741/g.158533 Transcript_50741/m.158533 type:complete len:208 (-) Transcript_50741:2501-3124(-)
MNNTDIESKINSMVNIFYCDVQILTIKIILQYKYISEISISKLLTLDLKIVKKITNSLLKEKVILFEDRLFKKLYHKKNKASKFKKFFKLRFWYFETNLFFNNVKIKINKISKMKFENKITDFTPVLICTRKICKKIYDITSISSLNINDIDSELYCKNILNQNIICGSKLENFNSTNLAKFNRYILNNKENVITLICSLKSLIDSK